MLGCPHPSAAHARLMPASSELSDQHKPLACDEGCLCVQVSLIVPGRGWAPVSSVVELGACWGTVLGQPCSAVTYGMGMGQAALFISLCHRPAASTLRMLCHCPSQLAVEVLPPCFHIPCKPWSVGS